MTRAWTSRLDRMIARLSAQRAVLERAAELVGDLPGPVLEIGLGKGRTYDHLRLLFAGRAVFAFDGTLHAPAGAAPPAARLVLGDFRGTLAVAPGRLPGPAAFAHADFGSEDPALDAAQAEWMGPLVDRLMAEGGVVASDRAIAAPRWRPIEVPAACQPRTGWRYHLWRVG